MLNGMAQAIQSGLIPGNRNADNISQELRAFEYLVYPSKSIQTDGIKAGLLTSFGFGQVGGQALIVHPNYLIGALEPAQFESYKNANAARKQHSYKRFNNFFTNGKRASTPFSSSLSRSHLLSLPLFLPLLSSSPQSLSSRRVLSTSLRTRFPFSST
jgi:hypothetical protein